MRKPGPATDLGCAPFGLIDALILVAAMALGVGVSAIDPKVLESALDLGTTQDKFERSQDWTVIRHGDGPGQVGSAPVNERVSVLDRYRGKRRILLGLGQIILPIVTLGAGLATFRRRLARSRRSLRHIGVLTTAVAAIFVSSWLANEYLLRLLYTRGWPGHGAFDSIWWDLGQDTGLAIAAVWVVLALGGRWRPARNWADRLGRIVGTCWIAATVAGLLMIYAVMPR